MSTFSKSANFVCVYWILYHYPKHINMKNRNNKKQYSNQHLKMRMNITCIIGSVFVCGDQVCEKQIIGWLRVGCSVGWANGQYKFLLFSFQLTTSSPSPIPTILRLTNTIGQCKRTTILLAV